MGRSIVLVLFLFAVVDAEERKISAICSVSTSPVNEGQPVEITCTFSETLTKGTFQLHHDIAGQDKPMEVVRCTVNLNGSLNCHKIVPGYYMDTTAITEKKIVVRINSAVKSQEGNYTCIIPGAKQVQKCELIIKEIPFEARCEVTPASKGNPTDVVFYLNKIMQVATTKFFITRQPFNAAEKIQTVVDCTRNDRNTCINNGGYEFNESFNSNLLIVRIQLASEEQEGIYHILIESTLSSPCYLILQDDGKRGAQTEMTDWHSGMLTAILCFVIILPIVCFALCYLKPGPRNAELLSRLNTVNTGLLDRLNTVNTGRLDRPKPTEREDREDQETDPQPGPSTPFL